MNLVSKIVPMDDTTANPQGTLGTRIRRARERARLSLRNLEAITGISRAMLHRLELDELDNPSAATLRRLADALELDSDDLFALMGYQPRTALPSLTPYLRARYQLPPDALAEATEALQGILEKYDQAQESNQSHRFSAQRDSKLNHT
jgi:transcriptional regulator with XRE-family HTH domain